MDSSTDPTCDQSPCCKGRRVQKPDSFSCRNWMDSAIQCGILVVLSLLGLRHSSVSTISYLALHAPTTLPRLRKDLKGHRNVPTLRSSIRRNHSPRRDAWGSYWVAPDQEEDQIHPRSSDWR